MKKNYIINKYIRNCLNLELYGVKWRSWLLINIFGIRLDKKEQHIFFIYLSEVYKIYDVCDCVYLRVDHFFMLPKNYNFRFCYTYKNALLWENSLQNI